MNHRTCRLLFPSLFALAACTGNDGQDNVPQFPNVPDARLAAVDARPGASPDAPGRDAPLPASDAAPVGPATLLLNEVASNQHGLHDLVELLVLSGGTVAGWTVERDAPRDPVVLATLPDVVVEAGQLIVVHLEPEGTTAMAETTGVAQHQSAANHDGAWDFLGHAEEIPYSNVVLALRAPDGAVHSAVPFFRPDLVDPDRRPRTFPGDLQAIIDAGLWGPACTPAPCGHDSDLAGVAVSWSGSGTDPGGASVARVAGGAPANDQSDWQPVPAVAPLHSFGTPN